MIGKRGKREEDIAWDDGLYRVSFDYTVVSAHGSCTNSVKREHDGPIVAVSVGDVHEIAGPHPYNVPVEVKSRKGRDIEGLLKYKLKRAFCSKCLRDFYGDF